MKKTVILTFFIAFLSLWSNAQDKSSDLKRLFEVMQSEKMIDEMMNSMLPILKQQASTHIQGENAQQRYEIYIEFIIEETRAITKRLVDEDMVQLYDKHFTHEEIKDLIAFFESATGQKMLEVTPALTQEVMQITVDKYMPELQEKLTNKLQELMESTNL